MSLIMVDFEVFGKVQGVYFRKYTSEQCKFLGLHGYCQNTPDGTVIGTLEGPRNKVEMMKKWLKTVGSPKSKIVKTTFKNELTVTGKSYTSFEIRR